MCFLMDNSWTLLYSDPYVPQNKHIIFCIKHLGTSQDAAYREHYFSIYLICLSDKE